MGVIIGGVYDQKLRGKGARRLISKELEFKCYAQLRMADLPSLNIVDRISLNITDHPPHPDNQVIKQSFLSYLTR